MADKDRWVNYAMGAVVVAVICTVILAITAVTFGL
jgi:hypothetical protein